MNLEQFLDQRIDILAAEPEGIKLRKVISRIASAFVLIAAVLTISMLPALAIQNFECYGKYAPETMRMCETGVETCSYPQCYCDCSPTISNHPCYRDLDPITNEPERVCTQCP